MFVAHIADAGIGIVIPSKVIHDFLLSDEVIKLAKERDERIAQ